MYVIRARGNAPNAPNAPGFGKATFRSVTWKFQTFVRILPVSGALGEFGSIRSRDDGVLAA
jgi:hypothetical protein